MNLPQLVLHKNADRRIKKGHLWIYSNEVDVAKTPLKSLSAGQQVEIVTASGQLLGVAMVNPNSLICGRLVSRKQVLDKGLLLRRLKDALALREQCFPAPYYRLVYGDSDFLPGLVVDRFNDQLVVQIASAGMDLLQDDIVQSLQEVVKPAGIILRNDHGARELEDLEAKVELVGQVPEWLEVQENGTRFRVPSQQGQKTGWFYDHRLNRAYLQQLVPGKRVLDVFSYVGGWGVEAAVAGAREVVCVDASESALQWLEASAEQNGVGAHVSTLQGKAVQVLKQLVADNEKFDVVVLDPPAFIKKRKDQRAGEAAYRHLNELAIRLLHDNGLLVSASCSMPLTNDTLMEIVRGAARHLDRNAQLIWRGGQGPDHPVHPAIPETEYLKAQFCRLSKVV
jgi:23S rRNA (cytosine1962-C5)-methyltransferase